MWRLAFIVVSIGIACKSDPAPAPVQPKEVGSAAPATSKRKACELISADEVGKLAATTVAVDPSQSGTDDIGDDHCAFMHGTDSTLILSIHTIPDAKPDDWTAHKTEAFSAARPPIDVSGLGDEAQYAEFKNGAGSNLLVRRGTIGVILSGNQRRDPYVAMAKLVLGRL